MPDEVMTTIRRKLATPDGFIRLCLLIGYPREEIAATVTDQYGLAPDAALSAVETVEAEVKR